jgi:hypothetical protein
MITVRITNSEHEELAEIRIEWLDRKRSRFSAEFAVDRLEAIGLIRRNFAFERQDGNVLALLKEALATLDDSQLEIEKDGASTSDLARRQPRTGKAVQVGTSRLHHNRSPLWSRQSKQQFSDRGGKEVRPKDSQ